MSSAPAPRSAGRTARPSRSSGRARGTPGSKVQQSASNSHGSSRLLPAHHELDHRERAHDDEEKDSHGTCATEFAVTKAGLVDVADENLRRVVGPALRHEVRLPEDLEMQDDLEDDHQGDRALEVRKRHVPESLCAAGIVEGSSLVDVFRDILKTGEKQDHRA